MQQAPGVCSMMVSPLTESQSPVAKIETKPWGGLRIPLVTTCVCLHSSFLNHIPSALLIYLTFSSKILLFNLIKRNVISAQQMRNEDHLSKLKKDTLKTDLTIKVKIICPCFTYHRSSLPLENACLALRCGGLTWSQLCMWILFSPSAVERPQRGDFNELSLFPSLSTGDNNSACFVGVLKYCSEGS